MESVTFYEYHIRTATQRYQEMGMRADAYTERSDRFSDLHTAVASTSFLWSHGRLLESVETYENMVSTDKEAERHPAAWHLTLEEPRVRGLSMRLPHFVPGQPVPVVTISGTADDVRGIWSLWQIAISTRERNRRRIMPPLLADNGMIYMSVVRYVWDQL